MGGGRRLLAPPAPHPWGQRERVGCRGPGSGRPEMVVWWCVGRVAASIIKNFLFLSLTRVREKIHKLHKLHFFCRLSPSKCPPGAARPLPHPRGRGKTKKSGASHRAPLEYQPFANHRARCSGEHSAQIWRSLRTLSGSLRSPLTHDQTARGLAAVTATTCPTAAVRLRPSPSSPKHSGRRGSSPRRPANLL